MSKLRTANLLGAMTGVLSHRLNSAIKTHPNHNDTIASALRTIALFEGCSNGDLSRGLDLSHSATVRLVNKLVASKLVESRRGKDKRVVALHLTDLGQQRASEVLKDRCRVLGEVVDTLSEDQQQQLSAIAETLLRSFAEKPFDGGHICRLCDHILCPADKCPVHQPS